MHNLTLSFVVIVVLIMVMLFMFREFYAIKKYAGWLVVPYILFLLFALYLNGVIIYLN
ncbi:tryptophan-rich sensory protein [Lachnospiraceae bacterium OttesenSCG-928-E19]|nr:tryptophan-rich sensory protein [Lachnospiraceae bacterium OttesenSCG-928-E19]